MDLTALLLELNSFTDLFSKKLLPKYSYAGRMTHDKFHNELKRYGFIQREDGSYYHCLFCKNKYGQSIQLSRKIFHSKAQGSSDSEMEEENSKVEEDDNSSDDSGDDSDDESDGMEPEEGRVYSSGRWNSLEREKCLEGYASNLSSEEISLVVTTRTPKQITDYIYKHKEEFEEYQKQMSEEEETMDFSEGKWLPEEHEKCLEGYVLDLWPREISLLMKTRSPKQVSDYIRGHKQQLDTERKKL